MGGERGKKDRPFSFLILSEEKTGELKGDVKKLEEEKKKEGKRTGILHQLSRRREGRGEHL